MQTTSSRKGMGGPKTPEGKARAALNAMKHGLWAESRDGLAVVAEQVGASFEDVHEEMCMHYHPCDCVEAVLVRRIARCAWRLMITETMENRGFARRRAGLRNTLTPAHETIIKRERLIEIQLHRAISALREKRSEQKSVRNELEF
jgi:hypothetical protein